MRQDFCSEYVRVGFAAVGALRRDFALSNVLQKRHSHAFHLPVQELREKHGFRGVASCCGVQITCLLPIRAFLARAMRLFFVPTRPWRAQALAVVLNAQVWIFWPIPVAISRTLIYCFRAYNVLAVSAAGKEKGHSFSDKNRIGALERAIVRCEQISVGNPYEKS